MCAEGDCGACTVLVGQPRGDSLAYVTVDACIQFLYQLDGRHVVTVEGLHGPGGDLHPVQEAMVACHGSQCGFCTPGFVMALAGRAERKPTDLRTSLTGNLCRCTGYVAILEAAASLDEDAMPAIADQYPVARIAADLRTGTAEPVQIESRTSLFFAPTDAGGRGRIQGPASGRRHRRRRHRARRRPQQGGALNRSAAFFVKVSAEIPGTGSDIEETADAW